MSENDKDYKKDYEDFWKDIVEKNGSLNKDQVMRELSDFHFIMEQLPKVYMAVTGGLLSKHMYRASTVIGLFEERFIDKDTARDDVEDMMKTDDIEQLKEELRDYFRVEE